LTLQLSVQLDPQVFDESAKLKQTHLIKKVSSLCEITCKEENREMPDSLAFVLGHPLTGIFKTFTLVQAIHEPI
jgi:hypothetical protein